MALDTTYTSPTYDAFATLAEMNDVMAELGVLHKNTFWSSLTDPQKEALIKAATRAINQQDWIGTQNPSIVVLTMLWPRTEITGVVETTIPYEIQLRMGCWIIYNAAVSPLSSKADIASKSVGDVSVTYNTAGAGHVADSSPCSTYANMYLASKSSLGGIGTVGLHRNP